jgi:hypothetical protein
MTKEYPTNRSISQLLSRGGFKSAGVRQLRDCSYLIPPKASGYGCAEMICYPPNGIGNTWRGVEISWYGEDEPPFSAIALLLSNRGFDVAEVDPKSMNTDRPSMTVWFAGAHEAAAVA